MRSLSNSDSDESDNNYQAPSSTSSTASQPTKRKKILTSNVAASLDCVNLSDRSAMFVVSAVAEACGQPLHQLSVSRSTIRRKRMKTLETVAEIDKTSFDPQEPLILRWDGKLLPDITGGPQKVDRVAILVTGGGIEKLLAVPKIDQGTGQEQATACLNTLDDWNLTS